MAHFKNDVSKKRILIIDDAGSMRSILNAILKGLGFTRIDEAADGESGLLKIKKSAYDLVFCDWEMPNMDGLELFRQLANSSDLKDIPFILVTSLAQVEKVKVAMAAGISEYVAKPFSEETIIKKLSKLFDSH